jgi:hypothetical protein
MFELTAHANIKAHDATDQVPELVAEFGPQVTILRRELDARALLLQVGPMPKCVIRVRLINLVIFGVELIAQCLKQDRVRR